MVEFLNTANLFMPREIFEKVGGFPEEIVTCEDYYFTNKVNKIGELYRTSRASFIHLGEDKNYRSLFRKEIWRGQSNLHTLKGRKIVLREIPSLLTPIWQVTFFLTAMVSLLLGKLVSTCLGLFLVILPTILYAIRLYNAGHNSLGFLHAVWFYCVYHSARAIGIVLGMFRTIKT